MPISTDGIRGHAVTREEFEALGLIDSRHFVNSATSRFQEWKSSFDISHPDWVKRAEVQDALAQLCAGALRDPRPTEDNRIRMLFTGASLGSVATYFHCARLAELDLLDRIDVEICDLLPEPLARTKQGDFEFTDETAARMGLSHLLSPDGYKAILGKARMWQANVTDLSTIHSARYDVTVAPYLHHHLNFADKALACAELSRVTKTGGFCLIGDLTFNYEGFSSWLKLHSSEDVPYALECFVTQKAHEDMFPGCERVSATTGEFYYAMALEKCGFEQ